ncbi:MAG: LysE family translocator, partial [Tepidimonas taiwanensis]|nr:LysE family translocator [Tepidimonas taiwanensis]
LWGGVGYLLWLAWRLARASTLTQARTEGLRISFVRGVGLQFLNIKAWMLALSIVAGWIAGHPQAWGRFWLVLPVTVVYAFSSNLTYALVGSVLRGWLAGPIVDGRPIGRRLRVFNRLMAGALALTGMWMLASGIRAPAV